MSALLLALLLQAAPGQGAEAVASPAPATTQAAEGTHTPTADHGAAGAGSAAEHAPEAGHEDPSAVIMHHVLDVPLKIGPAAAPWLVLPSKHLVFLLLAAALVILLAQLAVHSYRGGRIPRGLGAAVEGLVLFIRDDIAEPNIGHGDGRRFTPLLCSFFFFILVA